MLFPNLNVFVFNDGDVSGFSNSLYLKEGINQYNAPFHARDKALILMRSPGIRQGGWLTINNVHILAVLPSSLVKGGMFYGKSSITTQGEHDRKQSGFLKKHLDSNTELSESSKKEIGVFVNERKKMGLDEIGNLNPFFDTIKRVINFK